ncbi:nucleoside 2-deoxyribosyltransferase [Streptococcus mutans]|uniref:nucleoside 2-deoxyribosyltransferase n=1 Tax=Streptococcus mutans TaxID=1309 RepID=UPI0028EB63F8|nr:nucleoside 2-deoxyribosyltransferase [Streptococcus mutans]MDT9490432.1 nucleoside 2-deoxyribosyltransferase [Streptococcus mutans]
MSNHPTVFVITPFGEDFLALYDELYKKFENQYKFTNAGDLDNQQNIIKDIVQGINSADIVIADLTGLNPNVFYELGLAHAMNKKVIIITQDLSELPFDIKSYRANEYSLQFNKLPKLMEELEKLLAGAVSDKVSYGNPVSDYILDFFSEKMIEDHKSDNEKIPKKIVEISDVEDVDEEDRGYLDYITTINKSSDEMSDEIIQLGEELSRMNSSIEDAFKDIERLNKQGGDSNTKAIKGICRRLSEPIADFNGKLGNHVESIFQNWDNIKNDYLSLLDNRYMQIDSEQIKESLDSLDSLQNAIETAYSSIEEFRDSLEGGLGMERRLTRSINNLRDGLEKYLNMSDTMISSIDRIKGKSEVVLDSLNSK